MKAVRTAKTTYKKAASAPRSPEENKRQKKPVKPWIFIVPAIFLTLLILFFANGWKVTIHLDPGEDALSCPGEYASPKVGATLSGNLFFRKGISLPVRVTGTVDGEHPGSYEVEWRADFLFWSDVVTRTVRVVDDTPPVITLTPEAREKVPAGEPYEDPGFSAWDGVDGDVTALVQTEEKDGVLYYTVTDQAGNRGEATRVIPYFDPDPPVITLNGDHRLNLYLGAQYIDPGYSAWDGVDGDLTDKVTVSGVVDTSKTGTYTVTYTVEDAFGNKAEVTRQVQVREPVSPIPPPVWTGERGAPNGKTIYLTFDDGPGPYTAQLLDILKKYDVKATFFVVKGNHTAEEMDLIAREAAEGHTVAAHSYSHNYNAVYASEDAYFEDLNAINEIIREKTGSYTSLIRFPGGSSNKVSGFNKGIMTRLTKAVVDAGYSYFDWNVSSGDGGGVNTREAVYANVVTGCGKRDTSVVLQHDIKKFSVEAVEDIIQWGLTEGYTFLPLGPDSPGAHHRINN